MRLLELFILALCLASCSTEEDDYDDEDDEQGPQCAVHYAQLDRSISGIESEFTRSKDGYFYRTRKYTPGSYPDIALRDETGKIVNPDTENAELVVTGAYSYKVGYFEFAVMYTADKNGYRPKVFWKQFPCGIAVSPSSKLLQNLSG